MRQLAWAGCGANPSRICLAPYRDGRGVSRQFARDETKGVAMGRGEMSPQVGFRDPVFMENHEPWGVCGDWVISGDWIISGDMKIVLDAARLRPGGAHSDSGASRSACSLPSLARMRLLRPSGS